MARPRAGDPKNITIGFKVTASKAELIDEARGSQSRSEWLEGVVDAALPYHGLRERVEARPGGKQAMADARARREAAKAAQLPSVPLGPFLPAASKCPSLDRYGQHSYDDQTGCCSACGADMTQ